MSLSDLLWIDPTAEAGRIEEFVRRQAADLGKEGVVIGLSGGLDSSACAYLCSRALGRERILALLLPEQDGDPVNVEHARQVAANLALPTKQVDLTSILAQIGVYELFSAEERTNRRKVEGLIGAYTRIAGRPSIFAAGSGFLYPSPGQADSLARRAERSVLLPYAKKFLALSVAKVRLRMLILYYHAALSNYLVVGTTDRTEWTIGFYDKYGDGASDLVLLRHLYKTQIRVLAEHLGVPPEIVRKPSSADLLAGLPNEALIGLRYEQLDAALVGLERGLPDAEIAAEVGAPPAAIDALKSAIEIEAIKRSLPRGL